MCPSGRAALPGRNVKNAKSSLAEIIKAARKAMADGRVVLWISQPDPNGSGGTTGCRSGKLLPPGNGL
jgi:hypothetical protein